MPRDAGAPAGARRKTLRLSGHQQRHTTAGLVRIRDRARLVIGDNGNASFEISTRMWSNAQRDGRPAEYRWRRLFNAAKFG